MKYIIIIWVLISIPYSLFSQSSPKKVPQIVIEQGKQEESIALRTGNFQLYGIASYYGEDFHNKNTANGEVFNMHVFTAAHRTLPFNSVVKVTNEYNGKTVTVRINDRGPYLKNRVIDLSRKAAEVIGMIKTGTVPVTLEVLHYGKKNITKTADAKGNVKYDIAHNVHIQIASYSQLTNARRLVNKVSGNDLIGVIEEYRDLYRVIIPDVSPTEINIVVGKLKDMGFNDILVKTP